MMRGVWYVYGGSNPSLDPLCLRTLSRVGRSLRGTTLQCSLPLPELPLFPFCRLDPRVHCRQLLLELLVLLRQLQDVAGALLNLVEPVSFEC